MTSLTATYFDDITLTTQDTTDVETTDKHGGELHNTMFNIHRVVNITQETGTIQNTRTGEPIERTRIVAIDDKGVTHTVTLFHKSV